MGLAHIEAVFLQGAKNLGTVPRTGFREEDDVRLAGHRSCLGNVFVRVKNDDHMYHRNDAIGPTRCRVSENRLARDRVRSRLRPDRDAGNFRLLM